ncbi:MAG: hypothetical protein DCC71_21345 [Proteobacteria bacterium]|nr:MAG: hypothetical protein DCC71_21345 [Pseudomonadota bacterium]
MASTPASLRARRAAILVAGAVLLAGAACNDLQKQQQRRETVLNRIGYGPDPWSRQRIAELGVAAYIEEQLNPSALDDSALEAQIASLYPVTTMAYGQSRTTFHEYTGNPEMGPFIPLRDGTHAKILRAVKSKKQLEQVLVDFWYNHFNVDALIEEARWGYLTMERDAIRPHVFGKFEDMLRAVAQNPGMLDYLDNSVNFKTDFVYLGTKRGINENYAREILELHTVGVDGGYSQQDVREVARAFSGWTVAVTTNSTSNGFMFYSPGHDRGAKSVMGLELPANRGQMDGIDVIRHLSLLPQTAYFLSRKLCQRFISEPPPQRVVDAAAQTYLATGGDLRETVRTILLSPELTDPAYFRGKVKRPLVYVASLGRALGVNDDHWFAYVMATRVSQMGETLFRAGPPTGYPDVSRYWVGEGAYVARINLAWEAAHGNLGFAPQFDAPGPTPAEVVNQLQKQFIKTGIRPETRAALETLARGLPPGAVVPQTAATLLASPENLVH